MNTDTTQLPLQEDDCAVEQPELVRLIKEKGDFPRERDLPKTVHGPVVGRLVGLLNHSIPLVTFPGQRGNAALAARSTVDLRSEHIGSELILLFEANDPARPLIVGRLQGGTCPLEQSPAHVLVDADDARLTITAADQLVLRCGKASITLTRAGKILIDGTYVSSHASGIQRIKGAAVQIN
jgi:hypothetical protein